MRSRTSFFNKAFSLSLLRRFWPLWALWLALLLAVGLGDPLGYAPESYADHALYAAELNHVLLETGVGLACACIAAGPLMAMFMLGYLYSPRACNMVCALPMKREEAYFTAVLTGLVPMLLADALTWLLILLRFSGVEGVAVSHIHLWLGLVLMGNVGFYGMACFCGVLTGNAVVLPLVYVALGCAAAVIENTARAVLEMLVYGYASSGESFGWLAPIPCTLTTLQVVRRGTAEAGTVLWSPEWTVAGVPYLAGVCAAGMVLMLLAALILKRRHMETAGDIVAVPVLRPIFRVCMAVGGGLVLTVFASDAFFGNRPAAWVVFPLLILGAALGYFAAEMLIKKTLRVFDHGWKKLAVICACLVLPFLLAELDVTGFEKRVPEPEAVESVSVGYSQTELTEPASVEAVTQLHRELIAHKAENEKARRRAYTTLPLTYRMKDGTTLARAYRVPKDERAQQDPDSDLAAWQTLMNIPEARLRRVAADRDVRPETISRASLIITRRIGARDGEMRYNDSVSLTPEQAASLWAEGLVPDAREGEIARWYVWASEEARAEETDISVDIELLSDAEMTVEVGSRTAGYTGMRAYDPRDMLNVTVLTCSEHTLTWLEENLALTPESLSTPAVPNP